MRHPLLIAAAMLLVSPTLFAATPPPLGGGKTEVNFHGALRFTVAGQWRAGPEGTEFSAPYAVGAKAEHPQLAVSGCYYKLRKAKELKGVMSRFIDATGARKASDGSYSSVSIKKGFSSNIHFWDYYVPTDEVSFLKLRVSLSYPKEAETSPAITETIGMLDQSLKQASFGKTPAPKGLERCLTEP